MVRGISLIPSHSKTTQSHRAAGSFNYKHTHALLAIMLKQTNKQNKMLTKIQKRIFVNSQNWRPTDCYTHLRMFAVLSLPHRQTRQVGSSLGILFRYYTTVHRKSFYIVNFVVLLIDRFIFTCLFVLFLFLFS